MDDHSVDRYALGIKAALARMEQQIWDVMMLGPVEPPQSICMWKGMGENVYIEYATRRIGEAIAARFGNIPIRVKVELVGNMYQALIQSSVTAQLLSPVAEPTEYRVVRYDADMNTSLIEDYAHLEERVLAEIYTMLEHEDEDDVDD